MIRGDLYVELEPPDLFGWRRGEAIHEIAGEHYQPMHPYKT
jgi:hypothetical protein